VAVDLGNYDVVAALQQHGCALCRVLATAEVRAMDTFIEEGMQLGEATDAFVEHRGLCREHAWLFHYRAARTMTGVPVASMYEALLQDDLSRLAAIEQAVVSDARASRRPRALLPPRRCFACTQATRRVASKAQGLVTALREERIRAVYERSDGLCVEHLEHVGAEALVVDGDVALFLLRDGRRRLQALKRRLGDYARTRDYRHATERSPQIESAWTDVVRAYVGEPYPTAD
jgi:uncharacterized protein DUF6062